jgi:NAD+ synthase
MAKFVIDAHYERDNIIDWIKNYFIENGSADTKAVIGISGGKDSTVAAALLCRALGPERVVAVLMPNGEQTDIDDSYAICNALKIPADNVWTINIAEAVNACIGTMGYFNDTIMTNTPARVRMIMLYQVAAVVGGRVCNTGNASELYVGYTTKYGDLAGDFALLRNYYVRDVIAIGMTMPEVPAYLVIKTPGDGMSGSTDEERFGFTYETLDAFLIDKITPDYLTQREIERRHNMNTHKRCINLPAPGHRSRHEEGKEWHPEVEFWF